ncbi:MAG TPA: hypothetical protein VKC56_08640 [Gallionellaceae bacterium]|nr:hypothetical protein [Gallionellaceae bacterium]
MLETFTLITLSVIALIIFRNGRTPPLENPLTINRIGQFHAVLAPKINLAQPLLENASHRVGEDLRKQNTAPLYFKVEDKEVKSHGQAFYLLAATLRDGVLYFQAAAPNGNQGDVETIRAFSEAELAKHPESAAPADEARASLAEAITAAAAQRGATLTALQ